MSPEIANQVHYEVLGDPQNLRIAPMILIVFIENLFKHGVMVMKQPEMFIEININSESIMLKTKNVRKENDTVDDIPSGIGMKNVIERLQLLYPNRHKLSVVNGETYFKVNLEMKLNQPK